MEITTGHLVLALTLLASHFLPSFAHARFVAGRWRQRTALNAALVPLWLVVLATQWLESYGDGLRPLWASQAVMLAPLWGLVRANRLDLTPSRDSNLQSLDISKRSNG